jgi:hypothetical protein
MSMRAPGYAYQPLDPKTFLTEIEAFREAVADRARSREDLERFLGLIVSHAAMLDPNDAGFAGVGVSLKAALCAWLDAKPHHPEGDDGTAG